MTDKTYLHTSTSGPSNQSSREIVPCQPNLHATADELLKWTSELENHLSRIRTTLIGPTPEGDCKGAELMSIEDKLSNACTRVASLCGLARTILNGVEGE